MGLTMGLTILVKQTSQDPADAATFDRRSPRSSWTLFKRLDQAFSPVYVSIALTLLGMALLIILEIVLYRRYYWPGRASLQGPVCLAPTLN